MSDQVFSITGLQKRFGRVEALAGVTLAAGPGTVIGLIGRNGAGKTTLLRCLVGLQRPSAGSVQVFGCTATRLDVAAKQRLGYLSERELPFGWARTDDLIALSAPLYPRWDRNLASELLQRFAIDPERRLQQLSLGQRRAVGLLLALCPRPDLLVLDEPAANLDAVIRRQFLQQVLDLIAAAGATVLFSSHILTDVERIADRIAVLHHGQVLLSQGLDELKEGVRRLRLRFDREPVTPPQVPGVVRLRCSGREVLATVCDYDEQLLAEVRRTSGATVEVQTLGLEDLFIDLVGGEEGGHEQG